MSFLTQQHDGAPVWAWLVIGLLMLGSVISEAIARSKKTTAQGLFQLCARALLQLPFFGLGPWGLILKWLAAMPPRLFPVDDETTPTLVDTAPGHKQPGSGK